MSIPLYEPLNTLKKVADHIWIVDGERIEMDAVLTKIPFSTRMTVIRLKNNHLWLHSPIQPTEALIKEINALGEVKHLVSPNKIHYAYIQEWASLYPDAATWASPGVKSRADSQNIKVHFTHYLEDEAPRIWADDLDQLIFKGSRYLEEVVFFHKSSRTLILADLIENFEPQKTESRFLKGLYQLGGVADPDGKTPFDLRMTFLGRMEVARACYHRMVAWAPEKIILAHGRWYKENGVAELKRAFRWLD